MNNNNLTYRDLLEELQSLSEEQLNNDVVIKNQTQWISVEKTSFLVDEELHPDGVLETYHFYLISEGKN